MRFPFDTTIERSDDEIELRVIYDVTPFVPARLYGDYPHPAEGGECEIISVKHNGAEFTLTDAEEAQIQRECEERCWDDMADEKAAHDDWRYQEYRDRQLMNAFDTQEAANAADRGRA